MIGSERAAAVSAVGGAVVEVARTVEEIQHAVADRIFGALGPTYVLPAATHRVATSGVHATIRGTTRLVDLLAAPLVAATAPPAAVPLGETRRGALALAVLGSAWGDRLQGRTAALAPGLSLRHAGRPVALERRALNAVEPSPSATVVVFVHGLAGTELAWGGEDSFAVRLAAETGVSCLQVRYTTGRHVWENGADLHAVLEGLVDAWPVPLDRLVLVGHSMGGLVLRSAIDHGERADADWIARVSDVFHLGSPHRGAPLERWTAAVSSALRRLPETRPLSRLLDSRSAGVQDLRHGALRPAPAGDLAGDDELSDVPLLPTAEHHFVAATLARGPEGLLADTVGDLLVTPASATGRGSAPGRAPFPAEGARHVGRAHHLDLLDHPEVYTMIREVLRPSCRGSS